MTEPLADWEKELLNSGRTVLIAGVAHYVPLRDAIEAVQNAGYLVYELGELPKVTEDGNGKPKLPPQKYQAVKNQSRIELFYEEAFGKLALARWWEEEAVRRERRVAALASDLEQTLRHNDMTAFASDLVERGWRRAPQ